MELMVPRTSARVGSNGAKSRKRKRAEPINVRIFSTLRQRIIGGKYAKTGRLPPELNLMSEFKVSRHTVRTALQKLVVDGLIERRRGTRTLIVQRDTPPGTWAIASLDQMVGRFFGAEDLMVGPVPAKDYPDVAHLFGIGDDGSLFRAVRVLRSEVGPLAYSTVFTRTEFGSRVPRKLLRSEFFLKLLEKYCGLRAARARQVASAAIAPAAARSALELKENDPALVLQRTFFTRSGEPIEHVHMYCRPDNYAQIVDFYREDDMVRAASKAVRPMTGRSKPTRKS
jgi:GntR family transcriptional regulator